MTTNTEHQRELIPHLNPRFMAELPRAESAIFDHTAFIKSKTCKRLYFYMMVLGYRPRKDAIYFTWGIAYHKFREVLENTGDVKKAIAAGLGYWQKIQGADPIIGTKWDFLSIQRLVASFKAGYQFWKEEKTLGRIEVLPGFVEQQLVITLKDGKTKIGAKVDQLTRWNGRLWGRDFKTSSRMGKFYERGLEPNDQFMRQSLIETRLTGEHVQGIMVEVLYNTKKEGPLIKGFLTSRSMDQLERWEDEQIFLAKELERNREEDIWPQQEHKCSYCDFRMVCKQSNEKGMVAQLKSNYERKPWDFYGGGEDEEEPNDF